MHQSNKEVAVTIRWEALLSASGRNLRGSAVRDLFKVMRPGMISFGGGMPAPETFPCAAVERIAGKVLREMGPVALACAQSLPSRENPQELARWVVDLLFPTRQPAHPLVRVP